MIFGLAAAPLVLAAAYYVFLGHRDDYLGHYLAGFGATLGTLALAVSALPTARFARLLGPVAASVTMICIALGAICESTLYRIAKFDEVDFCNQSLGAVMAGMGAMTAWKHQMPRDAWLWCTLAWSALMVAGGYYFAFR